MSDSKNKYVPLSDLAKYLLDVVESEMDGLHFDIDWLEITGRKGRRTLKFSIKTVAEAHGRSYVLAENDAVCYENGTLTLQLPDKALDLT